MPAAAQGNGDLDAEVAGLVEEGGLGGGVELDQPGKEALLVLFDEAHASGATLVVATHELSFVHRADRLIGLADGEVRYDGAPGDADVPSLVFHT